MRLFFFLLVLANLLFFAWTRGYLGIGESDAPRAGEPLRAEQIRIVSNDQPPEEKRARAEAAPSGESPPSPPASQTPSPPDEACLALGDVPQTDADAIERLFAEKLPAFRLTRAAMPGNPGYWVLMSPFKTRREAENKVAELKKLGISEYFIMQEDADNFAISLGLFSTQAAAESSLAALRGKGARMARMVERPRRPGSARIEFRGPQAQVMEMRRILGQVMPQAKPADCDRNPPP
ncbi:MAG: hypothetical protein LBI87_11900 [Candidatus Accumulibacter sp.]|jgi:hypothetical protein|nr:hypothetical protein [Accumulibacter sp.]